MDSHEFGPGTKVAGLLLGAMLLMEKANNDRMNTEYLQTSVDDNGGYWRRMIVKSLGAPIREK